MKNLMKNTIKFICQRPHVIIAALALVGILQTYRAHQLQGKVGMLGSEIYRLRHDVKNIKSDKEKLEAEINNLESNVDDFAYSDWRSVVPEVTEATRKVKAAFEEIESNIDRLYFWY